MFLAARISYIRFFTAVQIYESYISKIIPLKTCFETGAQPHTAKSSFAKSAHIFKKPDGGLICKFILLVFLQFQTHYFYFVINRMLYHDLEVQNGTPLKPCS